MASLLAAAVSVQPAAVKGLASTPSPAGSSPSPGRRPAPPPWWPSTATRASTSTSTTSATPPGSRTSTASTRPRPTTTRSRCSTMLPIHSVDQFLFFVSPEQVLRDFRGFVHQERPAAQVLTAWRRLPIGLRGYVSASASPDLLLIKKGPQEPTQPGPRGKI
ncbi:hypothetical protein ZEAMMB73_Zm00001d009543 [Zea mays]|uniref:Photosystem I reaction center subunit VI n=1 Tax=Zea mays TaxID=4577 RepID=A0A1D6FJX4_MAIZE|nr:hypothetical protein ZEAMMB73_Zm00001d009543 [Zea mays]